jgi:HSP20 family molecular chaperone IbpA
MIEEGVIASHPGRHKRAPQSRFERGLCMSKTASLSSPFLLGFERALDRVAKAADGYPPYNIERVARDGDQPERLRITLAVAGFSRAELEITVEENELRIRGRQNEADQGRVFIHRGIAARQFQRTFLLADGMQVAAAELRDGLLSVDLERPEIVRAVRRVDITTGG